MATTSSSALDLLRPDPPVDKKDQPEKPEDEEEDELAVLRQAALASMMKAKAPPAFKVQAHPKRSNLLCIVVEDQKKPEKPLKSVRELLANGPERLGQPPQNQSPRKDKFNRFESGSEEDESEEEEEEVETETEVEVTDSENEAETAPVKTQASTEAEKRDTSVRDDEDVLNVDCREEEDEFSKFLNDFETELNDTNVESVPKPKKTKLVKKKKLVKRVVKKKTRKTTLEVTTSSAPEKLETTKNNSATIVDSRPSRSFSRSPTPPFFGRRYSRSPMSPYRRSPPPPLHRRRSRSPFRRGPSPPYRRPYSPQQFRYGPPPAIGNPPPPYRRTSPHRRPMSPPSPYGRYGSPPRRRQRSPHGTTIRFDESRSKFNRRGDSAPRTNEIGVDKSAERPESEENSSSAPEAVSKSKSLPPKGRPTREARDEEERKKQAEIEEKKKIEFEERLKRLPTPDRERVLARRRKFESSQAVKVEKKVISLKSSSDSLPEHSPLDTTPENVGSVSVSAKKVRRLTSEDLGDAISLSVDDTLDMFEETDESKKLKRKGPMAARIGKRDSDPQSKGITDLRVQLHRKRQQKHHHDSEPEGNDSLENAVIESSDDIDDGEKIRTALSGNRIVKPPAREIDRRIMTAKLSPRRSKSPTRSAKFVVQNTSPKSTSLKPAMRARLGDQVEEEQTRIHEAAEVSRKRKKTHSSGHSDSPKSDASPNKVSKKEKKKEKKDKKKKKEKKEKKEKRKKRKSKVSESEEEEEENQPEINVDAEPENAGNSSDEELWGFFENMDKNSAAPVVHTDKSDILMDKMRRKNEERLRRIKEIEEDKRRHQ